MHNIPITAVLTAIDRLGIRRASKSRGRWVNVLCPYHADRRLGSAAFNIQTGGFCCKSCGADSHIVTVVRERLGYDYHQACAWMGIQPLGDDKPKDTHSLGTVIEGRYAATLQVLAQGAETEQEEKSTRDTSWRRQASKFLPELYSYTRDRGFTAVWCEEHEVTHCTTGFYAGYFIVPICEGPVRTFEARKLEEYEWLCKFLLQPAQSPSGEHLRALRGLFESYAEANHFEERSPYWQFEDGTSPVWGLKYLANRKVRYPTGSHEKETLFRLSRLKTLDDLYLCEGIGGVPKAMAAFGGNVTATFGAAVSDVQLQILQGFSGRKIVLVDEGEGGRTMVKRVAKTGNTWVMRAGIPDDHPGYLDAIQNAACVRAETFLLMRDIPKTTSFPAR